MHACICSPSSSGKALGDDVGYLAEIDWVGAAFELQFYAHAILTLWSLYLAA